MKNYVTEIKEVTANNNTMHCQINKHCETSCELLSTFVLSKLDLCIVVTVKTCFWFCLYLYCKSWFCVHLYFQNRFLVHLNCKN